MASTDKKIRGYDDSRFEKDVDENFHCSICYNIVKKPRMCTNNEHIFCLACITEHLRVNSQTCPECKDNLSVATLRRARLASKYLSKLKINCDYASRECPEFTCLEEVKKEVKDVKESLSRVNNNVDEVLRIQVLKKLHMLEQLNKLPYPAERMLNTPTGEILIAGGYEPGESTEIYSWEENSWLEVSQMNREHYAASSFICKDQVYVVGGWDSKTIETLDFNKMPFKWMKYYGELNSCCYDHQTVVYQQRVIHIGGIEGSSSSDVISELQLAPPLTLKKLCKMPEKRDSHGAEIFEDKVLILGGEGHESKPLSSVLEFDVNKNECKEMPQLPRPLTRMATIRWRDQVVVLGGRDKDRQVLNGVFMYDCKTGKTTTLPSMLEKRCKCCAVITGNTIVVMGGQNEENDTLKSVEYFTMGGYTWKYLPDMNKERCRAVAEVLPCTGRYAWI